MHRMKLSAYGRLKEDHVHAWPAGCRPMDTAPRATRELGRHAGSSSNRPRTAGKASDRPAAARERGSSPAVGGVMRSVRSGWGDGRRENTGGRPTWQLKGVIRSNHPCSRSNRVHPVRPASLCSAAARLTNKWPRVSLAPLLHAPIIT
jgi:hypothetical protein